MSLHVEVWSVATVKSRCAPGTFEMNIKIGRLFPNAKPAMTEVYSLSRNEHTLISDKLHEQQ